MNVDYKILTKVLSKRVHGVMMDLVHPDQTCAVPGRRVSDNLGLVREAIQLAEERGLPLSIVSLDQEKAFDRVSHEYMMVVLERFGFGPNLRHWVDLMYRDVEARVLVNGHLSGAFPVASGVRQGCPMSPVLFVLCIEPFGCALRADPSFPGFWVPGTHGECLKVSLYMDDVSVFVTDAVAMCRLVGLCERFGLASSSKVNPRKSEVMHFGRHRSGSGPPCPFTERRDRLKILGVCFDPGGVAAENWRRVIGEIVLEVASWRSRRLTMEGRNLVIKTVLIGKLLYLARISPPPPAVGRALEGIIFTFFWGTRAERRSRRVVKMSPSLGGKGVPCPVFVCMSAFACTLMELFVSEDPGRQLARDFLFFFLGPSVARLEGRSLSLSRPFAGSCPGHFRMFEGFAREQGLLTRRPIGWRLSQVLEHLRPREVLREVRILHRSPLAERTARKVWENVSARCLANDQKDVAWKAAHECLPVRVFRFQRDLNVSVQCPRPGCTGDETVRHVLWDCPVAVGVWSLAAGLLECYVPWLVMVRRDVFVFSGLLPQPVPGRKWRQAWRTVCIVKTVLWRARTRGFYTRVWLDPGQIWGMALSCLQRYRLGDSLRATGRGAGRNDASGVS